MNANQRQALINSINRDLGIIQGWLNESFIAVEYIQNRFKEERKSIFEEIRRQTKRPATTRLVLYVQLRKYKVLQVPVADWKCIIAKGKSVDRAKATMAARKSVGSRAVVVTRPKGQMGTFSNSIGKNRKYGWRVDDLTRYTHGLEFGLVQKTEAELEPIRKRIAILAATGKSLAQSRYQHQKVLDRPEGHPAAASSRKKKPPPSLAHVGHASSLESQTETSPRKPDPPQFRRPTI